jgi:hypothetical protein
LASAGGRLLKRGLPGRAGPILARNAVAVAEAARDSEVRDLGEKIDNTAEAAAKLV